MELDLSREWLETNGIGGFASSTVSGCNTRRYHALLCAATQPPLGRMVLVNKVDEMLVVDGHEFELGVNQFPDSMHPAGYHFLRRFSARPVPGWVYSVPAGDMEVSGEVILMKQLWMPHGQNRTIVRYALLQGEEATLRVRPYITGRDYHGTHRANESFNRDFTLERQDAVNRHYRAQPYADGPPITFSVNGDFEPGGAWYYNFEYERERERGLDHREDAYSPGEFVWRLRMGETALLMVTSLPVQVPPPLKDESAPTLGEVIEAVVLPPASDEPSANGAGRQCLSPADAARREAEQRAAVSAWIDRQVERRNSLAMVFRDLPEDRREAASRLAVAADQFIVRRASDNRYTVIAGYPWFTDWGRDTMIALHGLCLTTKRFYQAASILLGFANAASEGMIPNRFPDAGDTPDYNTVDATLWFFHAAARYLELSGDWKTVRGALYPVLRDCIDWHIRGTRHNIKADPNDGLLWCGDAGTQLTWMDAMMDNHVFTPRHGKPVEIQALWYNALCHMADFARRADDHATVALCWEWSEKAKSSFTRTFWNEDSRCLFDCVDHEKSDAAIRPNQIFAVSLPHRMLNRERARDVVAAVQRELLTPYGLRSLSPRDAHYRGIYRGNQWERDGAYHQGTVWAWLIGPFITAYLHVNDGRDEAKAQARAWLDPLLQHLDEAGLDSISEIFDGDAPHTPRGCPAQAWSVAEVLRVLVEEL